MREAHLVGIRVKSRETQAMKRNVGPETASATEMNAEVFRGRFDLIDYHARLGLVFIAPR